MNGFIAFILAYFIEAIIFWVYSGAFFPARFSPLIRAVSLCCSYAVLLSFSFLNLSGLNIILYSLINFILLYLLYETKWYTACFHAILLSALMSACEILPIGVLSVFTPTFLQHHNVFPYFLIFVFFSKGLFFIAAYLLIFFFKKETRHPQKDWYTLLLLFTPIATMFTLATLIKTGEDVSFPSSGNIMISVSTILLLFSNIFTFGISQYIQKKSSQYTDMQLLLQKESDTAAYYEMLLSQHESQRILIHDMKKHLQSIEILNSAKEHEKIDAYIHTLLQSSDLTESARVCDHHMLNVILSRYQRQCQEKNITFHTDIRSGVLRYLPDADLTAVFCNILDNAIASASQTDNALIELNVHRKEHTPFAVITMINSCRTDPFPSHANQPVTSKKDPSRHGFGLKSVRRVAERYEGSMNVYYAEKDLLFHTIILLKQPYPDS